MTSLLSMGPMISLGILCRRISWLPHSDLRPFAESGYSPLALFRYADSIDALPRACFKAYNPLISQTAP